MKIHTISFQPEFAPMIEDGSKPHTVRRNRPTINTWDILHLYQGQRSPSGRLILATHCESNEAINITRRGIRIRRGKSWHKLGEIERHMFAFTDGFRTDPTGDAFRSMVQFFGADVPFIGNLITWTTPSVLYADLFDDVAETYALPTADAKARLAAHFADCSTPMLDQYAKQIGLLWSAVEWTKRRRNTKTTPADKGNIPCV